MIGEECILIVRQNRVKNVLKTLRLQGKLDETQDEGAALVKVCKINTKLSPQVPLYHHGSAYDIEFLHIVNNGFEVFALGNYQKY